LVSFRAIVRLGAQRSKVCQLLPNLPQATAAERRDVTSL
jgi:hypothetical protein